jgi:hypothetical protein
MPGWVKILAGLFAGGGVALIIIDRFFAAGKPDYWRGDPPEGMFTGLGVGALVCFAVWVYLFLFVRDRSEH